MKNVTWIIVFVVSLVTLAFCLGHRAGFYDGVEGTTEYFYNRSIPPVDPNSAEHYKGIARQWRGTAEHYGGICKWIMSSKPIPAESITMGDNACIIDCQILLNGNIEISGTNTEITNCEFRTWDMDWVNSLEAVDPNVVGVWTETCLGTAPIENPSLIGSGPRRTIVEMRGDGKVYRRDFELIDPNSLEKGW